MRKDGRGGKREGAGRPLEGKEVQKRRNISLSDDMAEKAKRIGKGTVSEGIRKALEAYRLED
jgi:hypothetical protein